MHADGSTPGRAEVADPVKECLPFIVWTGLEAVYTVFRARAILLAMTLPGARWRRLGLRGPVERNGHVEDMHAGRQEASDTALLAHSTALHGDAVVRYGA